MKKFWNSKEINEENLIDLITECTKNNWKNSDLFKETEIACEIIAFEDYEGRKEDIEYILEKLKDGATLFDVENTIANGDWYFVETETWKSYKTTNTKWQDVLEHAKYFAMQDWLEGIKPGSWEKKNATRDLEDHLRMNNTIWDKYKGTDEEHDVMKFFIKEYNKELACIKSVLC